MNYDTVPRDLKITFDGVQNRIKHENYSILK